MTIRQIIDKGRRDAGIPASRFARNVGMNRNTYKTFIDGRTTVSYQRLARMVKYLELNHREIMDKIMEEIERKVQ